MESVLSKITPSSSKVDTRDAHGYQYCVIFTAPHTFEVYNWKKVKFNNYLLKRFYSCNWESVMEDPILFNLLKKKIIQLLEQEVYFPLGTEHMEVPSIVIKGNLPPFPLSKCITVLPIYQRNVLNLNIAIEKNIGHLHFNNGLFIYTRITKGAVTDESDDSDEEYSDSDDSC